LLPTRRIAAKDGEGLTRTLRWILFVGSLLTVANIYYAQPLLVAISDDLHISHFQAGTVASLCQWGYAIGMFFIMPLGDLRERRGVILTTIAITVLIALFVANAPNLTALRLGALALGIASCTPQLLLVVASSLSKPEERGQTVGFVVSGILIGILWARLMGVTVAQHSDWRMVYKVGAGFEVAIGVVLWFFLPPNRAERTDLTHRGALGSLFPLIRSEPVLRESLVYGACLFGAFSAFWTTLDFYLHSRGAEPKWFLYLSLVGAAGAFAAMKAGKLADLSHPRRTLGAAIVITVVSFAVMYASSIWLLVIGLFFMDVGVQAAQATNISRVHALSATARSRLNTVYMVVYFLGGAAGAALGNWAWKEDQWAGVCLTGGGLGLIALANFFQTRTRGHDA
jgi:predicted MFS family arabinose efflux permease